MRSPGFLYWLSFDCQNSFLLLESNYVLYNYGWVSLTHMKVRWFWHAKTLSQLWSWQATRLPSYWATKAFSCHMHDSALTDLSIPEVPDGCVIRSIKQNHKRWCYGKCSQAVTIFTVPILLVWVSPLPPSGLGRVGRSKLS